MGPERTDVRAAEAAGASARMQRLDGRKRLERANGHIGLRTYLPTEAENPRGGQWAATWWNGPNRRVRGWATEAEMIVSLFGMFGRPGAEE